MKKNINFVKKLFDVSFDDFYEKAIEEGKTIARIKILEAELEAVEDALAKERKDIKELIKKLKASH
ncbi:hypothetical protein F9B85_13770 [Heliorestis acidaminivorans]|uniref:Uncharacterized protein n=1 Tax=Heliorestis acidaminivorans TaxID=553427 RepID=A0A6I0EN30_9FIRM|nr:hypothetical protein [Heliorestis acidaminivorans]KAB2950891.1 hypothetical protein F9B85_13770 [Heliorestis acidaminivorans]